MTTEEPYLHHTMTLADMSAARQQIVLKEILELLKEQDPGAYERIASRALLGEGGILPTSVTSPDRFGLLVVEALRVLFERASFKPKRPGPKPKKRS